MHFDKAYLISLEESEIRRNRFYRSAKKASVEVEWYKAVKGSEVDLEDYRSRGYIADDFFMKMPGSLGCLLSHVHVWEKIRDDKDCNIGLVFEDDALIKKEFLKKLNKIDDSQIPEDWDMIWLGWHRLDCKSYNKYFGTPKLNAKRGRNSGHFGYLVKSSSVNKLKSLLIPYNNFSSKDVILRKKFNEFNAYFLKKKIVKTPIIEYDSTRKNLNDPSREKRFIKKLGKKLSEIAG